MNKLPTVARALAGLAVAIGVTAPAQASEAIIKKARCVACHAIDQKRVGPAYKDVAAKYRNNPAIEAHLIDKVRNGGSGVWGDIPMPPNGPDKISDDDLKAAVHWILSLP